LNKYYLRTWLVVQNKNIHYNFEYEFLFLQGFCTYCRNLYLRSAAQLNFLAQISTRPSEMRREGQDEAASLKRSNKITTQIWGDPGGTGGMEQRSRHKTL